ncbi:MAG: putative pyridoxal-phosphate dependent enzyme [Nevskia sp.]|nr:putative pyridoxal-phosphate dependent enzyme [Nevskia sp.]
MDSASPLSELPTVADVASAATRIAPYVLRTPILRADELDAYAGCVLLFKCENLQRGGAFKLRGAMNAVWSLSDAEAAHGVATHSSGNHGAALARAARARGIPCHVVVPVGAVASKLRNIEEQGAVLHRCAPTLAAREAALVKVLASTGATPIHPYDDARVIAGQGTAARELLEEQPLLDVIIAPIGGGGLIGGTALVARAHPHPLRVIAAEPAGADDAARSFRAGQRFTDGPRETIADGLRGSLGVRNFALLHAYVDMVWTVDEAAIIAATRLLWERLRVIVEPSSAVPLAALLQHRDQIAGLRVGVILSGGNVDLDDLPWVRK